MRRLIATLATSAAIVFAVLLVQTEPPEADRWRNAATCTDTNGIIHYRGQAGFETCVRRMREEDEGQGQMAGTAPDASENQQNADENQPEEEPRRQDGTRKDTP
jgi:hypothetical protein